MPKGASLAGATVTLTPTNADRSSGSTKSVISKEGSQSVERVPRLPMLTLTPKACEAASYLLQLICSVCTLLPKNISDVVIILRLALDPRKWNRNNLRFSNAGKSLSNTQFPLFDGGEHRLRSDTGNQCKKS